MNATTLPDTIRTDDLLRAFGGAWPPQVLALLNGHTKPKPVPTASVVIDLLDAREFGGRSQIYIASLKHYNKRFAAKFPDMREVTSSVLLSAGSQNQPWMGGWKPATMRAGLRSGRRQPH